MLHSSCFLPHAVEIIRSQSVPGMENMGEWPLSNVANSLHRAAINS